MPILIDSSGLITPVRWEKKSGIWIVPPKPVVKQPVQSIPTQTKSLEDGKKIPQLVKLLTKTNTQTKSLGFDKNYKDNMSRFYKRDGIHGWNDYAIRNAAASGNLEDVKKFVALGADIHVWNDYPLRYAIRNKHEKVVNFLKSLC